MSDLIKKIEDAESDMTAALAGAEVRHSSIAYLGLLTTEKIRDTLSQAKKALIDKDAEIERLKASAEKYHGLYKILRGNPL